MLVSKPVLPAILPVRTTIMAAGTTIRAPTTTIRAPIFPLILNTKTPRTFILPVILPITNWKEVSMNKLFEIVAQLAEKNKPFRDKAGNVFVWIPMTQREGPDLLRVCRIKDELVDQWLRYKLYEEMEVVHSQAVKTARSIFVGIALTNPPEEVPASVKEEIVRRVVVHFTRRVRDFTREPAVMCKELTRHAKTYSLLTPGEELPDENVLTRMLHNLQSQLEEEDGILVKTWHSGNRKIRFQDARTLDTSAPPDTSAPNEVSNATHLEQKTYGAEDASGDDFDPAKINAICNSKKEERA